MKYEVRRHTKDGKTWLIGETDDKTGGDMVAAWIGAPDTIDIEVISDEDVAQGRCGRFFVPVPILSEPAKPDTMYLDEGGIAFPCDSRESRTFAGMSYRWWAAGRAMTGFLAADHSFQHHHDDIAAWAVTQADSLVAQLRRTEGGV